MNKILAVVTILLLGASGYLGYKVYKLSPSQTGIDKTKIPLANTCPALKYDYSESPFEGVINYEAAENLAHNYANKTKGLFVYNKDNPDALVPGEDSKSVWFSLEKLKNFIWHIEKQNCERPCPDSLGLRIYFGIYPDLYKFSDPRAEGLENVPKDYSFRHTLFMVPTYRDERSGLYYDFYPAAKDCRTPLKLLPTRPNGEFPITIKTPYILLMDMSEPPTGGSQNHGGLIPPGASTGTSF